MQPAGHRQGAGAAGVRHRHHHIDPVFGMALQDPLGQELAHAQAGPVHRDFVNDGVRPGQIDILEDAGRAHGFIRAHLGVNRPVLANQHRLARRQIRDQAEALHVQGHALRGDHVLESARLRLSPPIDQWPNAERVAEADDADADDHGHRRVGALAAPMDAGHGLEHFLRAGLPSPGFAQLAGKQVQQHFRIAGGIDVVQILLLQFRPQRLRVGEIAVVRQGDAVGRVDIHRLGFREAGGAGRGIAHMADAHPARQPFDVSLLKDLAHQPGRLAQMHLPPGAGHDAGGVLPAVLQHRQGIVNLLIDRALTDHSNNAAHYRASSAGE